MTVLVRSGSLAGSRRYALELVRPSSVVVAGGGTETATISAKGSVDFANATSLSLNDVFSAGYDNYMISIRHDASTASTVRARLRLSGTDATATDYTVQKLEAYDTTVAGARDTSQAQFIFGPGANTQKGGHAIWFYGPALAQPTAARNISTGPWSTAFPTYLIDAACTHSLSTAYDGITFFPSSGAITGMIAVYGLRG